MRLHRASVLVVVLGVAVTVALAVGAAVNYQHNQRRLTSLQTKLTASALTATPLDFQRRLGQIVGVVANSPDPSHVFRHLIARSLKPSGPFASAALIRLKAGKPVPLVYLGSPPIRKVTGPVSTALYLQAAGTRGLVTSRAVGHGIQKLGYLMGHTGSAGTFVVVGAQALPVNYVVPVPPGSPDAGLDVAIYFGSADNPGNLVASTSSHLPSGGERSKATVRFGTHSLTVVASPRTALAGTLAANLPWAVGAVGLAMTLVVALLVERLVRRRRQAEELADQNNLLYRQQREVALTLQRALLPREFPEIEGVEFAGVYLPGMQGTEVGGDWYSVVETDDRVFYFVVGDVSGRGVEAAALMAQLRFTIRTLARLGHDPADILNLASDEIDVETSGHFATVLVGRVDDRQVVTLASAGHLAPLLVSGEHADYAALKAGPPLGVRAATYDTVRVQLAPGTTLVAFTDGLVETRTAGLDAGLARLRSAAVSHAGSETGDLVRSITDELIPAGSEDDVALVVTRCLPRPAEALQHDLTGGAARARAAATRASASRG